MKLFVTLLSTFFLFSAAAFAAEKGGYVYISSEGEVIVNGKSEGFGANLVVDESDYAYEKLEDDGTHVVFNGKDMGLGHSPQISDGKLLYETEVDLKNTIVFDGKNYGAGFDPQVKDGHFMYFQKAYDENFRDVYQGKLLVMYDGKYYCDVEDNDDVYDKFDFAGDNVICEQTIRSSSGEKNFVVYNRKVIDEGKDVHVSENHYAYTKTKKLGGSDADVIIVDGKDLGEGKEFHFSEDSFYFIKEGVDGEEIVFNGKNIGEFNSDSIIFEDGHIAFLRDAEVREKQSDGSYLDVTQTRVIYDGVDRGEGDKQTDKNSDEKKLFLSGDHIAFERTVTGVSYEEGGVKTEKDVTFAVVNGSARTSIEPGSLRMDEGYFGFAKLLDVYDNDEEAYVEKYYIYRGLPDGSFKRLGEGDPKSIVVADGNVAYVTQEETQKTVVEDGIRTTYDVDEDMIMINGKEAGFGDITTLVMDAGQYGFSENVNGRWRPIVNGKYQSYYGKDFYFLELKSKSSSVSKSEEIGDNEKLTGKLEIRGSRHYLKLTNGKRIRVVPKTTISLKNYDGKDITVTVEKAAYKSKLSGKKIYAYKVKSFALAEKEIVKTAIGDEKSGYFRGTLERDGSRYKLRLDDNVYTLTFSGTGINKDELEAYIGDVVTLKMQSIGRIWKVYEVK